MKKIKERIDMLHQYIKEEDWESFQAEGTAIIADLMNTAMGVGKGADRARRNISAVRALRTDLYENNDDYAAYYDEFWSPTEQE